MSTIWRYMDFCKFKSLLERQSLYFSVAAAQKDKLEGTSPAYDAKLMEKSIRQNPTIHHEAAIHNKKMLTQFLQEQIVVNCWHKNNLENSRMWQEYVAQPNTGLVIQSTRLLLEGSFIAFSHPNHVRIDDMHYVDYAKGGFEIKSISPVFQFFHKDQSFSWENELRALINISTSPLPHHEGGEWNAQKDYSSEEYFNLRGLFVPVSLDILIEKIVLSPYVEDDFHNEILQICQKFNLHKPVLRSSIQSS